MISTNTSKPARKPRVDPYTNAERAAKSKDLKTIVAALVRLLAILLPLEPYQQTRLTAYQEVEMGQYREPVTMAAKKFAENGRRISELG